MDSNPKPHGFDFLVEELQDRTGLSPTRTKVLALIKMHKGKEQIADMLNITEKTVQNHIQDLRNELSNAEELLNIAGPTHYDNNTLYKEFGGALWIHEAYCKYTHNEDQYTTLTLYSSSSDTYLLVKRTRTEGTGTLEEHKTRTEFYEGADVRTHLYGNKQYDNHMIAKIHTKFLENAGIDPKYSPEQLRARTDTSKIDSK